MHAVLQWHVDVQAPRSCTPISTHLRPECTTICHGSLAPTSPLHRLATSVCMDHRRYAVGASGKDCQRGRLHDRRPCSAAVGMHKGETCIERSSCSEHNRPRVATEQKSRCVSTCITTYRSCCCQWHLLPAAATRTPPLHLMARVLGRRPGWTAAPCWASKALLQPLTSYRTQGALLWHMPQLMQAAALHALCCLRAAALAVLTRSCSDHADRSRKHPINMQFSCDERISTGNHVHACRMRMPPRLSYL